MLPRHSPSEALRAEGFDALLALGHASTLEAIYRAALSSICVICRVDRAAILLLDDEGVARFVASRGLSEEYCAAVEGPLPWSADDSAPEPLLMPDVASDPNLGRHARVLRDEGVGALAFVPLVFEGCLLGKFMLYSEQARSFDTDEVEVATSLAGHLAASIVRVRRGADRERHLVRERTLRRLLEVSLDQGSLEDLLGRCLRIILEGSALHDASRGVLFLADPSTRELTMVAECGVDEAIRSGCALVEAGHCLCGWVAAEARYLAKPHVDEQHEGRFPHMHDHGHRIAPVVADGELLGVLNCYAEAGRKPQDSDRVFLEAVCRVLAGIITRRRAQDALARAKKDLLGVLELAPEGIAIHREGRFVYANPVVERTMGYEQGELLGAPLLQVVAAEEREAVIARAHQMMETGEAVPPRTERMIRKDGSVVAIEVVAVPVDFEGLPSILVMARDVEERERLAAKALEADRLIALGTLAAGVGHEINNPLTYVTANLSYALEALVESDAFEAGHDVLEALEEAREGAGRIAGIVRDLKDMTRSLGEPVSVSVEELLRRASRLLTKQVGERARLVVEHAATRSVRGDPGRLGQVLLNLLVNASHACTRGSTEHRIVLRSWDEGAHVCIEVADDGEGIPPEILGRIYDPFFTTKPVGQGTGLGLSICRRIIDEHHGSLKLESELGSGTRVTLRLPAILETRPVVE
ncbi:MAG: GAF domain-containing protein [Deltaproteobacteria bacterium]|nr:GAF domain-containing protein [Deltaproteobacteria bacterium]